jgi:hypothetical protein
MAPEAGRADRQPQCLHPRVPLHHVRPCWLIRSFKFFEVKADFHAQLVCKSRPHECLIALCTETFDEQTCHIVAEVIVLKLRAEIAAQFKVTHDGKDFGWRAIGRFVNPVMARQACTMTKQVEHRGSFARERVAQTEVGHVIARRLAPVESPVVMQQRKGRCCERLGNRADRELCRWRHRQVRLDVALTPGTGEHNPVVLNHGKRRARHFPVGHDI